MQFVWLTSRFLNLSQRNSVSDLCLYSDASKKLRQETGQGRGEQKKDLTKLDPAAEY